VYLRIIRKCITVAGMIERDLTHGQRLLLMAVRALALETGCRAARPLLERACDHAGAEAHAMLNAFVQQLRVHRRRPIAIAPPPVGRLTDDERLMLDVFGCAQAEDYPGMNGRLFALMSRTPPVALGAAACGAAQIFSLSGLSLPPPEPPSEVPIHPPRRVCQIGRTSAPATPTARKTLPL
jgi:hypothetical protein